MGLNQPAPPPVNIKQLVTDLLRVVLKASAYDIFVEKVRRGLSDAFSAAVKVAVYELIEALPTKPLTSAEIEGYSARLDRILGVDLSITIAKDLDTLTGELYKETRRIGADSLGIDYKLSLPDKRAIKQLSTANLAWIKDNDLKSVVSADITKSLIKARELGLTRDQTATMLERNFGNMVPKELAERYGSDRYWDGFARQHATRTRIFADLDTYAAAGRTRYQIWARMNELTCPICGRLNGTVYEVARARESKEEYFAAALASDTEKMKRALPWIYKAPVPGGGNMTTPAVPPLHFHCHCHIKTYNEEKGEHESAACEVNLASSGDTERYLDFGSNPIISRVAYTVLDPHDKNIVVTEESINHITKGNEKGRHLKLGQPDLENYKQIPEAITDYAFMATGDRALYYIGKNGYFVVCCNNVVTTAYFSQYKTGKGLRPRNVQEAIEGAKQYLIKSGAIIYGD